MQFWKEINQIYMCGKIFRRITVTYYSYRLQLHLFITYNYLVTPQHRITVSNMEEVVIKQTCTVIIIENYLKTEITKPFNWRIPVSA